MDTPRLSPLLSLKLLGRMDVRIRESAPVESGYAKLRGLLAFLALAGGKPQRRDFLSAMFWPDKEESVAKQNLRRALFNLKSLLGEASGLLSVSGDEIALSAEGIRLDVAEFTREHGYTDPVLMERLAALYEGEFMAGFSLPECGEFEEWLQLQRESLHRRALLLLDRLATHYENQNDFGKALFFTQRYTGLEPLDEVWLRRAMRLFALDGKDSAALAQFDACRKLLKSELGVLPEEETSQLAARIKKGELLPRPVQIPAAPAPRQAERRQVSVLFCELPVAMFDDPEEAMAQLREPQERCAQLIRQFGGHIVQTHGGGLLAYFGYPRAQEDAARSAVRAALAVCGTMQNPLEIRACVHTGLIVTGGDDDMPDTTGKTSRLAMRLRQGAGAHQVVISSDTMQIISGYFDCTPLGPAQITGFATFVDLFAVERESGARTRLDAATQLTPLAGRKAELNALHAAWRDAVQGTRRIVLVQGEAGIGKSRLLLALKESLGATPYVLPEFRCFPEHSQSPFHPLIAMLEAMLQCEPGDTPECKFEKLAQYLETNFPPLAAEAAPLLAGLMSLPLREPYRMPELPPLKIKEMTIGLLQQLLRMIATQQPVLMVMEDLHWADPSSLEMLKRFVEDDVASAVLVLCTARPGFTPDWSAGRYTPLPLGHLALPETEAMIASLKRDMTPEQVARIAARCDGVPLFIEEMTKLPGQDTQSAIPPSLHDLLAARIDTLGPARHTAQLAATLGRVFRLDWLRRVYPGNDLSAMLVALQESGLVLPMNETTCQFKHALIQDAAYQSQTRADRMSAHQHIARMLQTDEAEVVSKQPELLAQHLGAGGEILPAIEYWIVAGQRAVQNSANTEAIGHFGSGLALLPQLPASPERDRLDAALNLHQGTAFIVTQGYGSLAARRAFSRAQELGEQLQDGAILFTAIWGKWLGASSCENYVHAAELADRLFELAHLGNDPIQLQQAFLAVGDCHLWRGQPVKACEYFEQGLALYRPEHHDAMVQRVGENVCVSIGSQLVWAQWLSGQAERATATGQRTLETARQLNHPYSLGYIHTHLMILSRWNGDMEGMQRHAEQALAIAQLHGFHIWLVSGLTFSGLARCYAGDESGLAQMQQGVAIVHAVMSGAEAFFISALGEAQGCLGHYAEAVRTLDQSLASGAEKDNRFWESETLRLKGEYLLKLAPGNSAAAEACFRQAVEVSQSQGAKALELRALASLESLVSDKEADSPGLR